MSEQMTPERFPSLAIYKNPVEMEKAIIDWWETEGIFEATQTAEEEAAKPHFVFYEGPPTANGNPGVHHIITRLAKDAVCRYKTMDGHFVLRKAGWDTHGLPVELEVQKQLKLETKEDIEAYGIGKFNEACRKSVFRYEKEWRELTRRIGYWLNLDDPYITCTTDYVESVWWLLKQMFDAGLIYEGHKVMPYNPRLGTVYSSHEVAQGYKEVEDPSITVRFKLVDREESLLVWTTTPWTLLSNVAAAVHPELTYVIVSRKLEDETAEKLILAEALLSEVLGDAEYEVLEKLKGADMEGWAYRRLYEYEPIPQDRVGARVVTADFVSAEDGTGIVHMAPAYGQDDYDVGRQHNLAVLALVGRDGLVCASAEEFAGLDFKSADPKIIKELKSRGLLFGVKKVKHTYPHCWRDHGPLIYYAQPAWFIETTKLKERFLAANDAVGWVPPEVGEKRFGDWLKGNIDWALSRDRYWGTPLPIWRTESGATWCVGSLAELRELAVDPPETIDPHKPMVDDMLLKHPETGEEMRRVPDVIDAWFDSGAMPFAQYHYPFENKERFESQFPADFICEAIDQSRGWFYSLLAISVFVKDCAPYRNVLVSGHIVDKHGKKMSKSLGNFPNPFELLEKEGADAVRLYIGTASPIPATLKFDPAGPREMNSKMLGTLRNTYAFFSLYANLDGWEPGAKTVAPEFSLLDRWIRSRYETVVLDVRAALDRYDLTRAAKLFNHFITEELSNWYVRRSRRRFWKGEMTPDKSAAYETLFGLLDGLSRLVAPFTPFIAEGIYRNLHGTDAGSVHNAAYPRPVEERRDTKLEEQMESLLQLVGLGRTLRNQSNIKIRQPLAMFEVAGGGDLVAAVLADAQLADLLLDELNVKGASVLADPGDRMRFVVKPRFKVLGPRLGGSMKAVAGALATLPPVEVLAAYHAGELSIALDGRTFNLSREELDFSAEGNEGFEVGLDGPLSGALDTRIDEALAREGHLREIINRVQNLRKSAGLEVSDRIRLRWSGGELTIATLAEHNERLAGEALALEISEGLTGVGHSEKYELAEEEVVLEIEKA
ncbi:MAG: isoleucine--tRNA ligase [bacterium]|nr:isoleucine--tRNA ligase [bacterium]